MGLLALPPSRLHRLPRGGCRDAFVPGKALLLGQRGAAAAGSRGWEQVGVGFRRAARRREGSWKWVVRLLLIPSTSRPVLGILRYFLRRMVWGWEKWIGVLFWAGRSRGMMAPFSEPLAFRFGFGLEYWIGFFGER